MTTTVPGGIALGALLALLPWGARSSGLGQPGRAGAGSPAPPVLLAQANGPAAPDAQDSVPAQAPPSTAPESSSPPAAPPITSSPPEPAASWAEQSAPPGQWVYTQQYGWVWMPYADAYTYLPPDESGEPYMYVYGPAFGWSWVVAPWVWGGGPWPYFGIHGAWHFGWYSHGWYSHGWYGHGWWGHPGRWGRPWGGRYDYRGAPFHDRAAPYRAGVPTRRVGPAPRAARPFGPGVGRPVPRPRMGVGAPRRR
jgi:hypothetical protein